MDEENLDIASFIDIPFDIPIEPLPDLVRERIWNTDLFFNYLSDINLLPYDLNSKFKISDLLIQLAAKSNYYLREWIEYGVNHEDLISGISIRKGRYIKVSSMDLEKLKELDRL